MCCPSRPVGLGTEELLACGSCESEDGLNGCEVVRATAWSSVQSNDDLLGQGE